MTKISRTEAPAKRFDNKIGKDGKRKIRKQNAGQRHAQEVVDKQNRYNTKPAPSLSTVENASLQSGLTGRPLYSQAELNNTWAKIQSNLNAQLNASNPLTASIMPNRGMAVGRDFVAQAQEMALLSNTQNIIEIPSLEGKSIKDIQKEQRDLYNSENPSKSKVTAQKIKNGPHAGKYGVFVNGQLREDQVFDKLAQAKRARQTVEQRLEASIQRRNEQILEKELRKETKFGNRTIFNEETGKWESTSSKDAKFARQYEQQHFTSAVEKDALNPYQRGIKQKPVAINIAEPLDGLQQGGNKIPVSNEPIIINPVEDNFEAARNTKPSRQERLKEIRNNPEKRARYNRLKLAQNPELKARYERFSNFKKTKGITGGLKKAGKWGAVAALAIGAGAFLLNKCSGKDDKPVEAETPTNTETVPENQETETQTTPAAPVEADEPTPVDETETSNAAGAVVEPGAGNAAEHATENEAGNTTGNVENSEQTSENIVQNGDTLEEVANRYGVTVEKLKELNADKIKKFRTADGKVIEGFRVGENISLHEDAKKVEGLKGKDEAIAEYEKELIENFENIPQAMWNQLCTPEFRKKHKLGEYKEAA